MECRPPAVPPPAGCPASPAAPRGPCLWDGLPDGRRDGAPRAPGRLARSRCSNARAVNALVETRVPPRGGPGSRASCRASHAARALGMLRKPRGVRPACGGWRQVDVDVLVVGGGVIGLAAAYHLSKTPGVRVTLLERDRLFNDAGRYAAAGPQRPGLHHMLVVYVGGVYGARHICQRQTTAFGQ